MKYQNVEHTEAQESKDILEKVKRGAGEVTGYVIATLFCGSFIGSIVSLSVLQST